MLTVPTAAALCALAYLFATARPAGIARSAVKTAAVALLALAAAQARAPAALTLALALCALGDCLLSRDTEATFIAGVAAFAAGHLAYVALFLTDPAADPARILQPPQVWIAAALLAAGAGMAALLARRAGALRAPVLAYVPVILGMGVAVLALPPAGALALALPAALAFIASDMILAAAKFLPAVPAPARRAAPYALWSLYWGAQAGFLAAFA